jgi:hypothetical protein
MPSKFNPTPQQQLEVARFVGYELWMLRSIADTPKPIPLIERNLWYEGLVLHTRVLRDFFFTKHGKNGARSTYDTDIVAVDYFAQGSASWRYTSNDLPAYLKANKNRMDWTLTHLTYGRLEFNGKGKDWSSARMRLEIGEKWFEFIAKLQAVNEAAAMAFLHHAKRFKLPLEAPF